MISNIWKAKLKCDWKIDEIDEHYLKNKFFLINLSKLIGRYLVRFLKFVMN